MAQQSTEQISCRICKTWKWEPEDFGKKPNNTFPEHLVCRQNITQESLPWGKLKSLDVPDEL